ncbi:MAG TPA: VOC family protein, partial [Longimicrobiaceae bacterium]|nr:VOC family protein [Longimicrobiaceae bacterium]
MSIETLETQQANTDVFPINGTDYIEFYVGNARQAAHYYRAAWGFQLIGYRGPETGVRDRASYLMQQDKIRFVLTTPIHPDASAEAREIADHIYKHGDGVRDLALWVDDARDAFEKAVERGAVPHQEPKVVRDDNGEIVTAAIKIYGDTIHTFVERKNYQGHFMPGYVK